MSGPAFTEDQRDAVIACANLVGRAGAKRFEIGHNDNAFGLPTTWHVQATYKGARITVEGHPDPITAADAMARRILTGAKCRCGKLAALDPAGAIAYQESHLADGTVWNAEQAAAAGQCLWKRTGDTWTPSCDAPPLDMPESMR